MTRLLYLVSHPIQYQAPLLRRIAAEPGITLRVIFGDASGVVSHHEPDFGIDVGWDVPLVEGYDSAGLSTVDLVREIAGAEAVWIHGWQHRWQRQALALAARQNVPVLMRGENWIGAMPDPPGPAGWLKRVWRERLFRRCRAFLAIGSRNRDYYRDHRVPVGRLFSMPYAVDNRFFAERATAAMPHRAALRRELGLPVTGRILLFAGKLMSRKRPDLLLEAWRSANWDERPALVFVGDGEMRKALQSRATGAVFVGFRNQSALPALYDLADLVVVPSEREPWGLVVNEAMACGTAVIASDEVGAAHDLIGADCGAVFRAGDRDELASTLVACLPRAAELGDAARCRIATWDFEADVAGLRDALASVRR